MLLNKLTHLNNKNLLHLLVPIFIFYSMFVDISRIIYLHVWMKCLHIRVWNTKSD